MDATIVTRAAEWAASLFKQRTVEFALGRGEVQFAHPAYRVSWHEIVQKFPDMKGPVARKEFQPAFDREIKKMGLWKVLQGKEKAVDWYATQEEK